MISLILSDVGGDPLDIIASGPTTPDPDTFASARAVLNKYHLADRVHPAITAYLQAGLAGQRPENPKPNDPIFQNVQNLVIANNHQAIEAATKKPGGWG